MQTAMVGRKGSQTVQPPASGHHDRRVDYMAILSLSVTFLPHLKQQVIMIIIIIMSSGGASGTKPAFLYRKLKFSGDVP